MRDFLRQFLLYSRSERRAVIALVVIIVIVILVPRIYHRYAVSARVEYIDTAAIHDFSGWHRQDSSALHSESGVVRAVDSLFYFDPNTIDKKDWVKLGLTEKQAAVIEKYKGKGGRFHYPDDLRKIFVMSDEMKDRLVPYVRIDESKQAEPKDGSDFYRIEINTADSADYEALYGIGPALSHRIVKYRGMLGGFYRVEQVGETYGVSDSTFQLIKPHLTVKPSLVQRIDINDADYETLRKHPYIHAKIAHAIINYRNMNGKFESLDQLKTLKPVTDEVYDKIVHYLVVK